MIDNKDKKTTPAPLAALLLVLLVLAAPASATLSLVWADEFNGTTLDTSNWNIDIGNGCPSLCGWGNNELEYYRAQNVSVAGGHLILEARSEYYGGSAFTSGKVHTKNKHAFLYGRIEMRAKIPSGDGMWPAFWMMPENDVYGGWASSGEIDIMEAANAATSIGGTIHYGGTWPDNTWSGASYSMGGTSFADDYHVYAVEWEPDEIRWYVDGIHYSTKTSAQWFTNAAPGNPMAPFDQEFYIILNAAVGGNYTGCTETGCITSDLPQQYEIDYVRVYQETDNIAPTVAVESPTEADNPSAGNILVTASADDADGVISRVEFFVNETFIGEDVLAPYEVMWPGASDGCYQVTVTAFDDGGGSASDSADVTVGLGCGQGAYVGSPVTLPARIEAEDFDVGDEGVAYHDLSAGNTGGQYRLGENVDIELCTDTGGGFNVGWADQGEWLEYTVMAPVTGEYPIEFRVASLSTGGTFRLEVDGTDMTGDVSFSATGGWQNWSTVPTSVFLTTGVHVMRFVVVDSGFNFNAFEILDITTAVSDPLLQNGFALHPCYPNPFNPSTSLRFDVPRQARVHLSIHDMAGRLVRTLLPGEIVEAGSHTFSWNGSDESGRIVSAGVYYALAKTDSWQGTRRMVLLK